MRPHRPFNSAAMLIVVSGMALYAFHNISLSEGAPQQNLAKRHSSSNSASALSVGTPTRAAPRSTPPKATPSPRAKQTATAQPKRVVTNQAPRSPSSPTSGSWIQIVSEGFEVCSMPCPGWSLVDLSSDGYERYWKDVTYWDGTAYRANSGAWAAWPARGGADGYSPSVNNNYSNNMDTRMIYGPFDLSDAVDAEIYFFLWREIEPGFDFVSVEVSLDGVNFQKLARWDGFVQTWEFELVSLRNFTGYSVPTGYSQVWVAWRFYSDYSITYQGPWVDDISIWKNIPGQVTAQGWVNYHDRNDARSAVRFATIHLFDHNTNGTDIELATIYTNQNGFFQVTTRNWEYWDSGDPNHTLDLYIIVEAIYNDSGTGFHQVTYISGNTYKWRRPTSLNVPDGAVDLSYDIPSSDLNTGAMWIFQDLRRGWEYIRTYTSPQNDPGSATVLWENGQNCLSLLDCGTKFHFGSGSPYIFIAYDDSISSDIVIHELGHQYMYTANGWAWPVGNHPMFDRTDASTAWSEGWADFFALAVNNDACFDWGLGPCGGGGGTFANLEMQHSGDGRPQGDAVEGRVAGALYDLFDNANDGFDTVSFGVNPIWWTLSYEPHTFGEFWQAWKARGYEKHSAVQAIYQNTIDYDTPPAINALPNPTVLQDFTWNQVIDLWVYAYDPESSNSQLYFWILNVTDSRCGVTLSSDTRYVNIAPQRGWTGSCQVTVSVTDGIHSGSNTFTINVVPIRSRIYLPFISK